MYALAPMRLIRAWNQTGQKFAGHPDIVTTFLRAEPMLLWLLVGATYFCLYRKLIRGFDRFPKVLSVLGSTAIILPAFTFKLAFTAEDSPELLNGVLRNVAEITAGVSLVTQARVVFIGLGLACGYVVSSAFSRRAPSTRQPGM
jgi:ethanolamine phosphate transferase 2 subunit G